MNNNIKFSLEAEMPIRWVPHFLAALKKMEELGKRGQMRTVSIVSDGNGDFRPKFKWHSSLPDDAKPLKTDRRDPSEFTFDAG